MSNFSVLSPGYHHWSTSGSNTGTPASPTLEHQRHQHWNTSVITTGNQSHHQWNISVIDTGTSASSTLEHQPHQHEHQRHHHWNTSVTNTGTPPSSPPAPPLDHQRHHHRTTPVLAVAVDCYFKLLSEPVAARDDSY